MNRLEQLLPSAPNARAAIPVVESAKLRVDAECGCSLFVPLHYEANYAYPLLVWLHGPGENEEQLKRVMPLISMRNYIGVAPRGVPCSRGASAAPFWSWPTSPDYTAEIEQRILRAITLARRKSHIAERRVFLAGFGCGGTTALRMAMLSPTRFAGALSLCGGFPQGGNPLAFLNQARGVPLFLACGKDGTSYMMDAVCDDLRLLHSAGMSVSLRVYPCGDEISTYMLPDMDRWIMEQISASQPIIKG